MTTSVTRGLFIAALSCALAACGGGGGSSSSSSSSSSTSTSTTYPSSGPYAWTYTVAGSTSSLEYGLAFGHASTPAVSYVVEPASSLISDVLQIDRGTVDGSTGLVTAATPSQLVYIAAGVLKQVPLVANGVAPAGTAAANVDANTYCRFITSTTDYASPTNSRIVVATAGPDNTCGTADDGAVIFTFSSTGVLTQSGGTYAAGAALEPLAPLRNPGTYAPVGWFDSEGVNAAGTETVLYPANAAVSVVSTSPFAALVTVNTALQVTSYPAPGATPTTVAVPVANCAWAGIGFDGSFFYTYCNVGGVSYSIYKVPYAGTSATLLASGGGTVETASLGAASVYATIADNGTYTLQAINKSTFALTTLESSTTVLSTMLPTSTGNDFLWQVALSGTFATSITVLNSSLATVTSYSAGYPSGYINPTSFNLNLSENRFQFLLLNGYSTAGASGATLVNYNTGDSVGTAIGTIPSAAALGGTSVLFTSGAGGSGDFLIGFATGISGTTLESQDSKAYSFTPDTASSLTATALP